MGRSRIKTRTAYFFVTPEGKLKKLNPYLLGFAGLLLLAMVVLISNRCYAFNRQLASERVGIHAELMQLKTEQYRLNNALRFCEEKKTQISRLLHFNTDSEPTQQAGQTDEK